MAATHKPFRELVRPGSRFEFVNRARTFAMLSALLLLGSLAMLFVNKQVRGDYLNWSIDFKGGTEMIVAFFDEDQPGKHVEVPAGDVRNALNDAGFGSFDVSEFSWTDEEEGRAMTAKGVMIRTPQYGALEPAEAERVLDAFIERFGGDEVVMSASWSGDRLYIRAIRPLPHAEAETFFAEHGLDLKAWDDVQVERYAVPEEGTGEYNMQFAVWGLDRQFMTALEGELEGIKAEAVQVYGVGAKAGEQLRNDGITSLFYAIALILLYLAFRFDIRYAPGAVAALLHDAFLVVGVFAVTWADVSLTSVAALLTVMGYSVNDTVVIFDRIRENVGKLKDKKLPRVINISLNETMSRSLLTSLTLLVVTLMMNIFGTGLIRNFAFAMNVGVIVGTYSSLFVAAPVMLYINNKYYSGAPKNLAPGAKKAR
jgi:preprotein translocase subunit SecF